MSASDFERALNSSDERVAKAARHVRAVQADIEKAKERMAVLRSNLAALQDQLVEEIRRVRPFTKPSKSKAAQTNQKAK